VFTSPPDKKPLDFILSAVERIASINSARESHSSATLFMVSISAFNQLLLVEILADPVPHQKSILKYKEYGDPGYKKKYHRRGQDEVPRTYGCADNPLHSVNKR
jgi:hypothetical protein